ncbi:uncharacterized protein LOC111620987 [Centruroides sculpturatus]|uniref:uncharacterized protein LOC111620987 n=1 Tax=Centruroides sculpturatus TaxID=218467 RepID=UPI000C6E46B7|nr:uncharacterized protein LOC111620987 [Centruroides sculpturatus]
MAQTDATYSTATAGSHAQTEAHQMLETFWQRAMDEIRNMGPNDFKNQELPLARIKKIMKLDDEVKVILLFDNLSMLTAFHYCSDLTMEVVCCLNGLSKATNCARTRKLEIAYQLFKDIYNKKSISINAKIRHYNAVIKPQALYAAEGIATLKMGEIENMEKKERKILRKILGPKIDEHGNYVLRSNKELYQKIPRLSDTIRRRRVSFFGHIKRMGENRLTKQIFMYFNNLKNKNQWINDTQKDMAEMDILEEDIQNRERFRNKIKNFKGFQEKENNRRGKLFTQEQRQQQSERLKRYWKERKKNKGKGRGKKMIEDERNDIAMAITKYDQFDFLIDIVPRDELKPTKRQDENIRTTTMHPDQVQYYFQLAQQHQAALQQQTTNVTSGSNQQAQNQLQTTPQIQIVQSGTGIQAVATTPMTVQTASPTFSGPSIVQVQTVNGNYILRHYNAVIKPQALYAAEGIATLKMGEIENMEKKERKILRKILGPKIDEHGNYVLRSNKELYQKIPRLSDTIRRRRVSFFGHIKRMGENRLTKQIFMYFNNLKNKNQWINDTQKDMAEMGILEEDIQNRERFRNKIKNFKGFQEKENNRRGRLFTQEQRQQQSERMKRFLLMSQIQIVQSGTGIQAVATTPMTVQTASPTFSGPSIVQVQTVASDTSQQQTSGQGQATPSQVQVQVQPTVQAATASQVLQLQQPVQAGQVQQAGGIQIVQQVINSNGEIQQIPIQLTPNQLQLIRMQMQGQNQGQPIILQAAPLSQAAASAVQQTATQTVYQIQQVPQAPGQVTATTATPVFLTPAAGNTTAAVQIQAATIAQQEHQATTTVDDDQQQS